jgi:hypothetical protein
VIVSYVEIGLILEQAHGHIVFISEIHYHNCLAMTHDD